MPGRMHAFGCATHNKPYPLTQTTHNVCKPSTSRARHTNHDDHNGHSTNNHSSNNHSHNHSHNNTVHDTHIPVPVQYSTHTRTHQSHHRTPSQPPCPPATEPPRLASITLSAFDLLRLLFTRYCLLADVEVVNELWRLALELLVDVVLRVHIVA